MLYGTDADLTNVTTGAHTLLSSTPSSSPPVTGTLKVGVSTWTQVLDAGDGKGNQTYNGSYVFTSASTTQGGFRISNQSGSASTTGTYTITGPTDITLTYDPQNMTVNAVSYNVVSTYKWRKVSDSIL